MAPRSVLALAGAAAVVASAGDLLLLWVAAATVPALALPSPPAWALHTGGLAGVLAIPCYGLGYAALAGTLAEPAGGAATVVRTAGWLAAALGSAIHGITGTALAADLAAPGAVVDPVGLIGDRGMLLVPLWLIAAVLVAVASWRWARAAWRGAARVPRWTALTNPALGTIALACVGAMTPLARALLLPAAPNLAHAAFFATTAWTLRR